MNITIRKISEDHFNFFINNKFYIGTVQVDSYNNGWLAQLLWDEGGNYSKKN